MEQRASGRRIYAAARTAVLLSDEVSSAAAAMVQYGESEHPFTVIEHTIAEDPLSYYTPAHPTPYPPRCSGSGSLPTVDAPTHRPTAQFSHPSLVPSHPRSSRESDAPSRHGHHSESFGSTPGVSGGCGERHGTLQPSWPLMLLCNHATPCAPNVHPQPSRRVFLDAYSSLLWSDFR